MSCCNTTASKGRKHTQPHTNVHASTPASIRWRWPRHHRGLSGVMEPQRHQEHAVHAGEDPNLAALQPHPRMTVAGVRPRRLRPAAAALQEPAQVHRTQRLVHSRRCGVRMRARMLSASDWGGGSCLTPHQTFYLPSPPPSGSLQSWWDRGGSEEGSGQEEEEER